VNAMSQLPRPSMEFDDLDENDFGTTYFRWPRTERTCAAITGTVDVIGRIQFKVPRTTSPSLPRMSLAVYEQFVAGTEVLDLHEVSFTEKLGVLLKGWAPADADADLGAPNVDVLLGAFSDLTSWLGVTKQNLARYLQISPSTVMAWRRERPAYPRHRSISTLLTLWSAVSGARDEFGAEQAVLMAWSSGRRTDAGVPALPASALADWLIKETSEANLADFLNDDGYQPGTAPLPTVEDLTAAEAGLHSTLNTPLAGSDDTAGG
jgi:hypothetical protein